MNKPAPKFFAVWVYYKGAFPKGVATAIRPGKCFGGGTDSDGVSDASYEFRTEAAAKLALARVKKIPGVRRAYIRISFALGAEGPKKSRASQSARARSDKHANKCHRLRGR